MNTKFQLFLILSSIIQYSYCQDIDNEKSGFKTIKIMNQIWMAHNLNTATFSNGDSIPEIKSEQEWELAGKEKKPAFCYYNNDSHNGEKYGKLYNWFAISDTRGLAPKGWHIPSSKEWIILNNGLLDITNNLSGKNNKIDSFDKFTSLSGGNRNSQGTFSGLKEFNCWWSSTEINETSGGVNIISSNYDAEVFGSEDKRCGYSVRCLKD